jgi:hypothetical protein
VFKIYVGVFKIEICVPYLHLVYIFPFIVLCFLLLSFTCDAVHSVNACVINRYLA